MTANASIESNGIPNRLNVAYGSANTRPCVSAPNASATRCAGPAGIPRSHRYVAPSRASRPESHAVLIAIALFAPIPSHCRSLTTASAESSTSRISDPHTSTIRPAVEGPTP